ncbi:MAG: tRNA pseudouridine(54/55) synthase Pus10 [Candidatus Aenigmatarchaeota archaeon]
MSISIFEKLQKIFEFGYVCDNCIGRQFAQLLSGFSNDERGKTLRMTFAMFLDSKPEIKVEMTNFYGFRFHNKKISKGEIRKPGKCKVCNGLFKNLDSWLDKIIKEVKKYQFKTFVVGTVLSSDLLEREERLWELVGINFCEPIKAEINRTIGRMIEKRLGVVTDLKYPDINVLLNLETNNIKVKANPLFIQGEYQKLVRGISQSKSRRYKISVEEIIAKPIMKITKGKDHKFHGAGREDVDARCLDWRPFVLEIIEPRYRFFDLKKIEKNVDKKIKVRGLKLSNIDVVRRLKSIKIDKEYEVLVNCNKEITKNDLKKLKKLVTVISQHTPKRVLQRRANKLRKRMVKSIKVKYLSKKSFLLRIRSEAGLYVKELVTGDDGRTKPSVTEILRCKCVPKKLDVVKIYRRIFNMQ